MENELLAPNGKPSNLNATQYKLVRSKAFLNWFGDWINDPANASKVVDDNGEPLVVYHGSDNKFNVFDIKKAVKGFHGLGFYFSDRDLEYGKYVYNCFLNLKKPFDINADYSLQEIKKILGNSYFEIKNLIQEELDYSYNGKIGGFIFYSFAGNNNLKKQGYDGLIQSEIYVAFIPNQIKLADGTNTNFDENNPDIRYEQGGEIDWASKKSISIKINNDLYKVQYQRGERGDTDKNVWFAKVISKNGEDAEGRLCFAPEINTIIYGFSLKEVESWIWNSYINNELYLIIEDDYGYEKEIIHIEFSEKSKYEKGGRTMSQTPSPKKDQIVGSDLNKKSSSKNLSSAKLIKFDEKTLGAIKNKVKEHNEKYPNKKINLASAKAVVRRGMGAYSSSHRPTISSGKPNSRVAWGLARLNAFTYKIVNGKSKSGKYNQDDDLIEELGFKVANYENGGKMSKDIRCINCGWEWNKKDSELWDMYICHKCGFDNTSFYTSDGINRLLKGGRLNSNNGVTPNYLKMFLDL